MGTQEGPVLRINRSAGVKQASSLCMPAPRRSRWDKSVSDPSTLVECASPSFSGLFPAQALSKTDEVLLELLPAPPALAAMYGHNV
jgi:hypothetical protein